MMIKDSMKLRVYGLFIVSLFVIIFIIVKIAYIQFYQGAYWSNMAEKYQIQTQIVHAPRGSILSEEGNLLSVSNAQYDLYFDGGVPNLRKNRGKKFFDSLGILCGKLAVVRPQYSSAYYKNLLLRAFNQKDHYVKVLDNLSFQEYQQIKKLPLIDITPSLGGFIFDKKEIRSFLYGDMAKRSIGLFREGDNMVGIEKSYDKWLRGTSGKRSVQKIGRGIGIPIEENEISPKPGKDIVTTINIEIQDIVSSALKNQLQKLDAVWGTCVVMEVKTGKIKAIANLDRKSDGSYVEDFNYAVTNVEPGSTVKLLSLMALLEDGHVDLDDTINIGDGEWKFQDVIIKDSDHKTSRNKVSVQQAFEISSNVGISKIVNAHYKDDFEAFYKYFSKTKTDQLVSISIPGEQSPIIGNPNKKTRDKVDLIWSSFGYGIHMSPISILTLYNGIANEGKIMNPYLISAIVEDGEVVETFEPTIRVRKMCSNTTLEKLQKSLIGVVQHGTASLAKNTWYPIAGKTGTAKVYDPVHIYSLKQYLGSFVGYFPADKPQYSCIIFIKNKPNALLYYGSNTALPAFKEIADKIMAKTSYLLVQPAKTIKAEQTSKMTMGNATPLINKAGAAVMPSLKSWKLSDAIYFCESNNIKINYISGTGNIVGQSISPGIILNQEIKSINLYLE